MAAELEAQVAKQQVVTIAVNDQPVEMRKRKASGSEIKQAAIAQGVQIQPDFVLSVVVGGHRTRVVGDEEPVELHQHQHFVAVAPDDNS